MLDIFQKKAIISIFKLLNKITPDQNETEGKIKSKWHQRELSKMKLKKIMFEFLLIKMNPYYVNIRRFKVIWYCE